MLVKLLASIFSLRIRTALGKKSFVYEPGNQFPPGSENLQLPPILFISIYMGKPSYHHLPLLFESMTWNPSVDFTLVHVVTNSSDAVGIKNEIAKSGITNFFLKEITLKAFGDRVFEKLNIRVPFTPAWYYKMCDYKPTLAYLFPELFERRKYVYWGYGDMDVIWGNISRFSHWFQVTNQPFVISEYFGLSGQATFFINEAWTREMFLMDKMYVPLLKNFSYHNLDEGGQGTQVPWIVDNGAHSLSEIQKIILHANSSIQLNRGKVRWDRAYSEEEDAINWAGPAVWFRGTVKLIHSSQDFPAGRELMFYHRAYTKFLFPDRLKEDIIADMKLYGYLLPYWIPLLTRHQCRNAGVGDRNEKQMAEYRPYDPACFPKHRMRVGGAGGGAGGHGGRHHGAASGKSSRI